jgi:hypothetical protein
MALVRLAVHPWWTSQIDAAKLRHSVDSFPDLRMLTDRQLVDLIAVLTDEEHPSAYLRSVARGKVRVLRAELDRRSGEGGLT